LPTLTPVDERYEPATIDVDREAAVTITFRDGHVARFELVELRQACPCARCRGLRDQGEPAWPRPGSPEPLRIEHAELHGAWGLTTTWNDGHATGISPSESLYPWPTRGPPFRPDSGLGL